MLVRINQVLLVISVVLLGIGLATGCLGCGPGSTDAVGGEANVASDNTTSDNTITGDNIVDGKVCEGEVLYDPWGNPVCYVKSDPNDNNTYSTDPPDGIVCVGKSGCLPSFCPPDEEMICNGDKPDDPEANPPVEDAEQCSALTPGDGQWFREVGDALMEVTCLPKDGKCAVTFDGVGTSFTGTYLATELPVVGFWNDPDNGYEYILEFDVMDDGNRSVQRTILNGKLAGESFFRR